MIPDPTARRILAFGVVTFVLIAGSEFEPTGKLAVAFAYLILLSIAMAAGPVALRNIAHSFGGTIAATPVD